MCSSDLHRPVFVFATSAATGKSDELKGSGRSIPGFHLRDALDLVAKRSPGTLLKFGGHAIAAGCTIARGQFDAFRRAFEQVATEKLDADALKLSMNIVYIKKLLMPYLFMMSFISILINIIKIGFLFIGTVFLNQLYILRDRKSVV